jgi:hypothetical protein
MTMLHYEGSDRGDPRLESQRAFARVQYARKHFSPARTLGFRLAMLLGYVLRAAVYRVSGHGDLAGMVAGGRATVGVDPPPFGAPPQAALNPTPVERLNRPRTPEVRV